MRLFQGRHKRNATFPVSKSVTNVAVATNGSLMQPTVTSTRSGKKKETC